MPTKREDIKLTPAQMEQLSPLFVEVNNAADVDKQGAILGQVWDRGPYAGEAVFYWLDNEQATIVRKAIARALKLNGRNST